MDWLADGQLRFRLRFAVTKRVTMFDPVVVRALLIEAARQRQTFTYSALLNILGHAFTRPLMRQLCKVLDRIDEDGRAGGEPGLAVLVVRQSDGLPGQGWFAARSGTHDDLPLEWEGPEARRYTEARQAEAFDYWEAR
jgi:hypothetical protein